MSLFSFISELPSVELVFAKQLHYNESNEIKYIHMTNYNDRIVNLFIDKYIIIMEHAIRNSIDKLIKSKYSIIDLEIDLQKEISVIDPITFISYTEKLYELFFGKYLKHTSVLFKLLQTKLSYIGYFLSEVFVDNQIKLFLQININY